MSYKLRSNRRIAKNAKRKFYFSIILVLFLLYASIQWILPASINGATTIVSFFKKPTVYEKPIAEDATVAPPVFSIPFEATNSAKIDISGYAASNTKVEIFLDDVSEKTVEVSSDGTFIAQDISLNLGTNNIYGKTIDNKKTSLPSKTIKIIYNRDKPKLEITSPEDSIEITGDKKIIVSGQTTSGIKIFINNGQAIVDKDGKFTTTIFLNDGENIISIKALDNASNVTEIKRKVTFKSPEPTPEPTPTPLQ